MREKNGFGKVIAWGAAAATAGVAAKKAYDYTKKQKALKQSEAGKPRIESRNAGKRKAYFVGGGLGSLAGAAYLIRDCKIPGEHITIFEGMPVLGGSNDGIGTPERGFVCRGGRMLNEETYENFWELFRSIPSLNNPGRSVTDEILNFDHAHPTSAKARLVDKDGKILDVKSMGFTQKERMALFKLMNTPEEKLDDMTIEEWFADMPHFFTTNFWYMWQTTFAFQKWSSLFEFRRYMRRMILEFSRIETLEGVTRTPLNQYDSVIRPLETYLRKQGVVFEENCTVKDIDFADGNGITAKVLHLKDNGIERSIELQDGDICIMTNACMTDSATLGNLHTPAPAPVLRPISGELWSKVAAKKPGIGNPYPFFGDVHETNWESFTVTSRGNKLLKMIENFSGNVPGSGALMTFKDSSWLMSIVVAAQPHFINQPMDQTVFWGYGLYTDREGDYVKKPMKDCTGEEMLIELLHHLHMEKRQEEILADVINVIPCMMPYVDAQFQPRKMVDRPKVVPAGSTNFAMASQFVEIPDDMVFTEEYSVRAARMAVYTLMGVDKKVCPVTPYVKNPKVLKKAVQTSYR
ncbi:oleate hydratase [Clostridium sp. Marseille-P2415]|uniref:oleate hydratase n=1 Tax=Clostridium sp. Marseille-P2415 TaxID=1805471 RepID=UPI0009883D5B|nr:oleate hydratase [Clostridium sp. Marseille-P2415]